VIWHNDRSTSLTVHYDVSPPLPYSLVSQPLESLYGLSARDGGQFRHVLYGELYLSEVAFEWDGFGHLSTLFFEVFV
jgi:hypothetical protein